mgnify:FL=1
MGVAGCVALAVLRANLPESNNPNKRNISLFLCAIIISLGVYRLILMPYSIFNIWINLWLIAPGIISLFFLSNKAVSVWSSRELSISAVEYGLERNAKIQPQHKTLGSHITLLHFVVITRIIN